MNLDASEERIQTITGAIEWKHDFDTCACAWDAPDNEEAFMSPNCAMNYFFALNEHIGRVKALLDWTHEVEAAAVAKFVAGLTEGLAP